MILSLSLSRETTMVMILMLMLMMRMVMRMRRSKTTSTSRHSMPESVPRTVCVTATTSSTVHRKSILFHYFALIREL